ncbi:MAG: arginyl-tRNA synthetase [Actinomycetota bacterium]|nr:arginyl-tRNA synthetase [Actinomycetota bacterium]
MWSERARSRTSVLTIRSRQVRGPFGTREVMIGRCTHLPHYLHQCVAREAGCGEPGQLSEEGDPATALASTKQGSGARDGVGREPRPARRAWDTGSCHKIVRFSSELEHRMNQQHVVVSLTDQVHDALRRSIAAVLPDHASADPLVRPSDHADLQVNAALGLAKPARRRPADLAADLVTHLTDPLIASADVSGPGFINITLRDVGIWTQVRDRMTAPRLGIAHPETGRRTVIDYSAPNIAKEMHVGHLRTTIIGDALARILTFLGGDVIRQNHLGDWGTQFGMLIQYLDEHPEAPWHADQLEPGIDAIGALDGLYRAARATFEADPAFADRSRARVVALQAGDPETVRTWKAIIAESQGAFNALYTRLGVLLTDHDVAGESFYNPMLPEVADELERRSIAVDSQGALCVFDPDVTGPDGSPIPLMVRKSDGGYGYDTTDLATIRYRTTELKADRILYVVDSRQALHFRLIFSAARRAGWLTDDVEARHIPFGTVLGPDGRPFKTRSGGTVRLSDLLDDSVASARTTVREKNPAMSEDRVEQIAEQAGVGAVKYADLSTSRIKDYTFDPVRMTAFAGDTGVYLQYAHTRICSILDRADTEFPGARFQVDVHLELHPTERALALALDQFAAVLAETAANYEPHRLCGYLFSLAKAYSDFYEACPVLRAPTTAVRGNRLALCRLTAATLAQGLDLLGIAAPRLM